MSQDSKEVNDTAVFLAAQAFTPILADELWQDFGYEKRPRHGKFFNKFFDKDKLAVEHFIVREMTALAFLDIVAAVRNVVGPKEDQVLILVGTALHLCATMDQVFDSESYFDYLAKAIKTYAGSGDPHETTLSRASACFDLQRFPKFLAGMVRLVALRAGSVAAGKKTLIINRQFIESYLVQHLPVTGKIGSSATREVVDQYIRVFMEQVWRDGVVAI
jgi:hypothetical protein